VDRQIILDDPDDLGIGIMDVDEIAHASGVVFCRSPLDDFDLGQGTMNVEENEETARIIATILVIVTFELTRPGVHWLTDLTDELHRAFVEAYHRLLVIGRFGIEVEYVHHAGDVLAIDLRSRRI
jgi:hypothetical protein